MCRLKCPCSVIKTIKGRRGSQKKTDTRARRYGTHIPQKHRRHVQYPISNAAQWHYHYCVLALQIRALVDPEHLFRGCCSEMPFITLLVLQPDPNPRTFPRPFEPAYKTPIGYYNNPSTVSDVTLRNGFYFGTESQLNCDKFDVWVKL